MKYNSKIILLGLFLLCSPKLSSAADFLPRGFADSQGFVINFQNQNFELTTEQLNQNSGEFFLPKESNLIYHKPTNEQLAENFFGQTSKNSQNEGQTFRYDPNILFEFISNIANAVQKPSIEPSLTIVDNYAKDFNPGTDGVFIDPLENTLAALTNLNEYKSSMDLIFSSSTPKTALSETNSLGINELIAEGVSNFKGSPSNRRHNIKVGVEKFKGLIIQKGEEFSFNKYLGPVEAEQGFLPELVIKASGTVPELGGGLCQVSSTTFRAAMEAGLPITQRRNHAYAVQYYSPQGTDATIYPGVIDLKFKNNTPGAILVWPHFEMGDTLIFDFYGTKDNRVVTLEKPTTYDRKPDGSMKAEWTRIIEKDGVTSSSTFKSIYQSPALFHKEEKFVTAAPTPTPTPTPKTN